MWEKCDRRASGSGGFSLPIHLLDLVLYCFCQWDLKGKDVSIDRLRTQLEGMRARSDGQGRKSNPYPYATDDHEDWATGFDQMDAHIQVMLDNANNLIHSIGLLREGKCPTATVPTLPAVSINTRARTPKRV
jgi:hypothetical protein